MKRNEKNIPLEAVALLGTCADTIIAKRFGTYSQRIQRARAARGIKAFDRANVEKNLLCVVCKREKPANKNRRASRTKYCSVECSRAATTGPRADYGTCRHCGKKLTHGRLYSCSHKCRIARQGAAYVAMLAAGLPRYEPAPAAKRATRPSEPLRKLRPVDVPYSEHEAATIARLYRTIPASEIGRLIGRSKNGVVAFAWRNGISISKQLPKPVGVASTQG